MFVMRHLAGQIVSVLSEPKEPLVKSRQAFKQPIFIDFSGDERQQPNERSHLQENAGMIEANSIVIEAVFLIPKSRAAQGVNRVGNLDEVFKEFRGHVFIGGINSTA